MTRKDCGINRSEDLKGKSVAVTRGTDPYIFLLRTLDKNGLSENDINAVLLQHPDGHAPWQRAKWTPGPASTR